MNLSNRNKISATTSFLVVVYVALMVLWAMVWLIAGDATWWLTLLNRLVPYFFLPVPLLLALALLARRFKLLLLLAVPGAIFGLLYYPYLLPQPAPRASAPDLQHIDYIFYRGDLEPLNIYTIQDSGGSDHLPVLATYSFR